MKKIISLFLAFLMTTTSFGAVSFADGGFSDLSTDHWAYSYITELVSKGTIKGYEDGSFKPDKLVTRAEFVKMIGNGPTYKETPYNDVSAEHWGYEYIMSSGVKADVAGNFYPDSVITREMVAEILWQRNGKKTDVFAPSIITEGAENKTSVAWAYTYGLMQGDDGVNLRLSSGLKRSEAAALIVRASLINSETTKKSFEDVVSSDILNLVYSAVSPFDGDYTENKTITNGEMARAALKIGCEESTPSYQGLSASSPFEHKYAKDLYIMGRYCIGSEKITQQFADSPASFKDTVAFLAYNFVRKSSKAWNISQTTKSLDGKVSQTANKFLTFADKYGIISLEEADLEKAVTQKDFTCLLILFDNLIGIQSAISTDTNKANGKNIKTDQSMLIMPYSINPDFAVILEGVPNDVYSTDFEAIEDGWAFPKDTFRFAKDFNIIFVGLLSKYTEIVKNHSGAQVRFTFYPSLCFNNGYGYTLRVKCDFISVGNNTVLDTIFPLASEGAASVSVKDGDSFFIDLETGTQISGMDLPAEGVYINKVIK